LDVSRARLLATLRARGIGWQEDPSNGSPAFERTRVRAAAGALAALGLTRDSLILSAHRLQRARVALERAVDEFCDPPRALLTIAPCGFMRIDAAALRNAPREIAIRVLLRAISAVGGGGGQVPLAKLEAVASGVCARERGDWTLARAHITAAGAHVDIVREAGRAPPPRVVLAGGQQALWDGRFLVRARGAVAAVEVRALGAEGVRAAAAAGGECPPAPRRALHFVPAFYRDGALIAAPNLAYWAAPDLRRSLSAEFAPLCSCNIAAYGASSRERP
jgi:tRNA(Ile)-lysidine synthase